MRPAILLLSLVGSAAPGGAVGPADLQLRGLAGAAGQAEPILRIGLEPGRNTSLASRGAFRILDATTGQPVWKASFSEQVQVVVDGGPKGELPTVYRIQVGAFQTSAAAEEELQRLERLSGARGIVQHDPDRSSWRVRLGREEDRLALNPLIDKLRQSGVEGLWVAEEPAQALTGLALRLVDASYASFPTGLARLAVVPGGNDRVEVGGKPYRGVIELRLTAFGTLRAINWIELDQYLLGVVPAELGPELWPLLEAQKAQAVAARTYAWRNRRQFEEEGFDLCSTPRCQVYEGAAAEHPLSDRAVWSTRGEIVAWKGDPIVALYTATCGGHTEDGAEIFPEQREPYLEGVPCRAETDALATQRAVLRGRKTEPVIDETGAEVTRDWALLSVSGVISPQAANGQPARREIDPEVLREATRALSRLARRPEPTAERGQVGTLGQAALSMLADLGWGDRAEVLLSAEDLPALLRDPEAAALPLPERRALAYLVWVEGLRPFADGRFQVGRPASLARLAPALVRIGDSYEAFGLRNAELSGAATGSLRLVQGKGEIRLPLADRPFLFGLAGGKPVPSDKLELWPGDRVRFRTSRQGAIDFLELLPPVKGTSDDRSARVYSWEERKSRQDLEVAVNRRVEVGRLLDLQVLRRGVSGRVVELKVVGSTGTTVVRGFDVRRLLDLRESLLVIEVQRGAQGEIEAVVFAGKGWGHGVGLCQVGAYGMALRGSSYREILTHYYTGVTLARLAPGG